MYCKSIIQKYSPHVSEIFPYDGRITWKGYYLTYDKRTFHGVSFTTDDKSISKEERDRIFNAYLVKREVNLKMKVGNTNIWYSNPAASNWGITYTTVAR
jgi:hypothetical protein